MTVADAHDEVLWGIGCYEDARGVRRPWRISHAEIGSDIDAATAVITDLGLAGSRVLWCSMLSQAGQFWPYVCGTVMAGARLSCADATAGDAARVAMFLRLMDYQAVFGVTRALLDGLAGLCRDPADVFAGVRLVGAHPDAYRTLTRAGLEPVPVALCGPVLVVGREPGGPAYAVGADWELSAQDDHICVTSRGDRAQPFACTPTAVRGTIVDGGVVPSLPVVEDK